LRADSRSAPTPLSDLGPAIDSQHDYHHKKAPEISPLAIFTMRITDAEKTNIVDIPNELALAVGIFKDMMESGAKEGPDPVRPSLSDWLAIDEL
jgi:hypothetical protein